MFSLLRYKYGFIATVDTLRGSVYALNCEECLLYLIFFMDGVQCIVKHSKSIDSLSIPENTSESTIMQRK